MHLKNLPTIGLDTTTSRRSSGPYRPLYSAMGFKFMKIAFYLSETYFSLFHDAHSSRHGEKT
jgi:hypothetical protein